MSIVGIMGAKTYQKKFVVEDVLDRLYANYGKMFILASGGNSDGPEHWTKRFSQANKIKYYSFNPSYTGYKMFSYFDKEYYGKKFHHSQNFVRYKEMSKFCDIIIVFKEFKIKLKPDILYGIDWAKKFKKKVFIVN